MNNPKIGILVSATWKFTDFLQQFVTSLDNFCPGYEKTVFLFTDNINFKVNSNHKIVYIQIAHEPWPFITLHRYRRYYGHRDLFKNMDYLFHYDVDMKIVNVGPEILNPLVAIRHPLFFLGGGSWETNPKSTAYVANPKNNAYYCGGVQGGERSEYLVACKLLAEEIEDDLKNGIIAQWHDESHWNRYLQLFEFTELHPGYCFLEEENTPFEKRIVALNKDKSVYREKV